MFKVNFSETPQNPVKLVVKQGKVSTVTIRARVEELPPVWNHMPPEIMEWIKSVSRIALYENKEEGILYICSNSKAVLTEGDKYDSLLGERLAESKAMLKIYDFFYKLIHMLYDYYVNTLFGDVSLDVIGKGWSLEAAMRKYGKLCECEKKHIERLLESKKADFVKE